MSAVDEYDIEKAFKAIEEELIASMIRNMKHHKAEETKKGIEWSMWQAEQLKSLERYRVQNNKKYIKEFGEINQSIGQLIRKARQEGNMSQEVSILRAIKKGFKVSGKNQSKQATSAAGEFFKINDRKMDALIKATTHDIKKAEMAILRSANDRYRKTIFNAQVYANSGAATYEKAVDMATKDMLSTGLKCVEYKNGARHTLYDYADMAIRTANKRAYLTGEGEKRKEWGISTVIINKRGSPCPLCLPFVGKVLIDDVWSGGSNTDGKYPLMSAAIAAGLYHPRCRDSHTTYFPGISTADDTWTPEELASIENKNKKEQKQLHDQREAEKHDRLAEYSLDKENRKAYRSKAEALRSLPTSSAAEEAVRNTGTAVKYNPDYDYSLDLDGYSKEVNAGLSEACRKVAELGGSDKYEHMYLVDLETGSLSYYETNGEPKSVGYKVWDYLKVNQGKFAFVHNHNTDGSLSETDLTTLLSTPKIPMMIAVRNDSVKYVAERKGDVLTTAWYDELYLDEINVLNKALKDGKITASERSKMRELLIVENLLRDYTKGGGLVEYDGRK